MSLWPIKVKFYYEALTADYFMVDYEEFREWAGVSLDEATDEQILSFLEAGDEFSNYGHRVIKPEIVSRGELD